MEKEKSKITPTASNICPSCGCKMEISVSLAGIKMGYCQNCRIKGPLPVPIGNSTILNFWEVVN
ncbi:hypothetical protein KAU51_01075 [Candidatus Parcubacteria bacterium]|nr:hypothetical protein [Candidatus Parcubacteria bacterium]